MLGLADVQLDVLALAALADDHAGVDFVARLDEECSAVLRVEQAVSYGDAGLK